MDSLNSAADVVYAHSARTVFNFRMGVVYSEDDYNSEWAKLGDEGMASYWPQNPWYAPYLKDMPAVYYPNLQIGNGRSSAKVAPGSTVPGSGAIKEVCRWIAAGTI
jgi:hypothetical protein